MRTSLYPATAWKTTLLGEFLTLKRGYDLSSSHRKDGTVPVVSSSGITGRHDTAKIEGPGVVTGRYGTLGDVFYIKDDFWPLNTSLYVCDFKGNDPRFSAYFLCSVLPAIRSDKAAVPGVNRNDLHALPVRVTRDVDEQRKIASFLSAYDDLIENNRRRIRLLERTARLLYKEWFVRFRYSGHQHVGSADGLPETWKRTSAFEVIDVLSGGTPDTKNPRYWNGKIPFFTPKDSSGAYVLFTERHLSEEGLRACNSKLYPKGTVFITARGTVGKLSLAQTDMAMSQSCYALVVAAPMNPIYLYLALLDGIEQLRSRAVGSVFSAITRNTFRSVPFVVPERRVICMFTDIVSPIFRHIEVLSLEMRKLAEARDLLLPRLMTGRIRL